MDFKKIRKNNSQKSIKFLSMGIQEKLFLSFSLIRSGFNENIFFFVVYICSILYLIFTWLRRCYSIKSLPCRWVDHIMITKFILKNVYFTNKQYVTLNGVNPSPSFPSKSVNKIKHILPDANHLQPNNFSVYTWKC